MAANQREKMLVIGSLICVAVFALDRLAAEPLIKVWKARSARIAQLDQAISSGNMLRDRKTVIDSRWKMMRERSLPSDMAEAENGVLGAVSNWAKVSGLNLTGLKPHWVNDDTTSNRLDVRVSGGGSLQAIARFLFELEASPLALRLEDVEVRSRDDRGGELTLEARFTGLILPEVKS